ncbi:MAG: decarboxylating NADP(+)-dependent phosphogluconate dehydrogenase [Chlamydiales bacterium]|nr:decarboxylating NADP(+)-dependent phosphogluconate dehydrogenase [Chlamydiales bacterium]
MQPQADIGLIGLAVMGQNLVLNMADHGFTVAVFNRTTSKVDEFMAAEAKGKSIVGTHSMQEFFKTLKRPRRVMFMVKAGAPVDDLINQCLPFMEPGDIIIDGGNSNFFDTNRRTKELKDKGFHFLGVGISGGEEGARFGPSIMPGGSVEAWPAVKPIFQAIAAKVNGEACCDWVGEDGAGHYVKMVHNGIEYGDMQLISETYDLMKRGFTASSDELQTIFSNWNKGKLDSYLIEITAQVFKAKDTDGSPLVDKILDVAGQKGTGKWTAIDALNMGMPLTLIGEAVFARFLSSMLDERKQASTLLKGDVSPVSMKKEECVAALEQALYASKIISYAQGFLLMREAAKEYGWKLNFGAIALMWRGGCIIRSAFLGKIKEAYEQNPNLQSLLLAPYFVQELSNAQKGWRKIVSLSAECGIPTPCISTALAFFDGYRSARLPANLIQAQRDFFGAHTYERIDKPRGEFIHTNWMQ